MTGGDRTIHRKARNYRWEGVDELPYKEDDRARSSRSPARCCSPTRAQRELRYFEVAPGGFSTLERHEHMHAVLILRGAAIAWSAARCGRSRPAISSPCRR